jgi:putative redox protein
MITGTSKSTPYRTQFSDGTHEGFADTSVEKGGANAGFRPPDLLEAALASCVSIAVRVYADNHGIPLTGITTKVQLDRLAEETVFRYEVEFDGDLTLEQKHKLTLAANACTVHRLLSKPIRFESGVGVPSTT